MKFLTEEHTALSSASLSSAGHKWYCDARRSTVFSALVFVLKHFHVVSFIQVSRSKPWGEPSARSKARRPEQTAPNKVITGTSTGCRQPAFQKYELEEHHSCLTLQTACFNGGKRKYDMATSNQTDRLLVFGGEIHSVSPVDLSGKCVFFLS